MLCEHSQGQQKLCLLWKKVFSESGGRKLGGGSEVAKKLYMQHFGHPCNCIEFLGVLDGIFRF